MPLDSEYGPYIGTASGKRIYYLRPDLAVIDEWDLYMGLKNQRRYAGQLNVTILEHLCLCIFLVAHARRGDMPLPVDMDMERVGMHLAAHDLHEAFVLDLPSPLKAVLPEYKERIERPWEKRVHEHFGLELPSGDMKVLVKYFDRLAYFVEATVENFWKGDIESVDVEGNHSRDSVTADMIVLFHKVRDLTPRRQWELVIGCVKGNCLPDLNYLD